MKVNNLLLGKPNGFAIQKLCKFQVYKILEKKKTHKNVFENDWGTRTLGLNKITVISEYGVI